MTPENLVFERDVLLGPGNINSDVQTFLYGGPNTRNKFGFVI